MVPGERVVAGVAHAADVGLDADLGEPLAPADRRVLTAAVAVVNETEAGPSSGSARRINWTLSRWGTWCRCPGPMESKRKHLAMMRPKETAHHPDDLAVTLC